jgi:hypothetical protein
MKIPTNAAAIVNGLTIPFPIGGINPTMINPETKTIKTYWDRRPGKLFVETASTNTSTDAANIPGTYSNSNDRAPVEVINSWETTAATRIRNRGKPS